MSVSGGSRSERTQLLLMAMPFVVLVFLFAYLPLYGWIYALFNYKPGIPLFQNEFVGFKFFTELVSSPISRAATGRVLRNTFAISFLNEMRFTPFKKVVQTTTTLPNFISWILVYAVFFSFFSVDDGFLNNVLLKLKLIDGPTNVLANAQHVWIFQTGVTIWKTLGWNAIIYLAAISGIDPELYDAAHVDGAGRLQSIWHITVPGLSPTYFVLLMLAVANLINNGLEQYFVFENPMTKDRIEVLDLYVYNQGIANIYYSASTAISVLKSLVSLTLLFAVNGLSKLVRGYSII